MVKGPEMGHADHDVTQRKQRPWHNLVSEWHGSVPLVYSNLYVGNRECAAEAQRCARVFPMLHLVDASSVPVDERVTSAAFFRHAGRLAAEAEAHVAAGDNVVVWCDTGLAKAPAVVALLCRGLGSTVSGIVKAVARGRQGRRAPQRARPALAAEPPPDPVPQSWTRGWTTQSWKRVAMGPVASRKVLPCVSAPFWKTARGARRALSRS